MFVFNSTAHSPAQIEKAIEQMRRDSLTPVRGAEPDSAQRLKAATRERLFGRTRFTASATSPSGQDFGEKVKQAAQKHPNSQASHRKRVEQERTRRRTAKLPPPDESD